MISRNSTAVRETRRVSIRIDFRILAQVIFSHELNPFTLNLELERMGLDPDSARRPLPGTGG